MLSTNKTGTDKTKTDSQIVKETAWNPYNEMKLKGVNINDQTTEFFKAILPAQKEAFHTSSKRIIQFGISTGHYVKALCSPSRSVAGYDYSETAINHINDVGMTGRLVDLNQIHPDNNKRLAYQPLLETDLSVSVDILMVRILEYLNPETVMLLIFSLLDLARIDSTFYFEILSYKKESIHYSSRPIHFYHLQSGYVASFFAPRTDIEFVSHRMGYNEKNDICSGEDSAVERLIVKKR